MRNGSVMAAHIGAAGLAGMTFAPWLMKVHQVIKKCAPA
jgi:hypothetical protein